MSSANMSTEKAVITEKSGTHVTLLRSGNVATVQFTSDTGVNILSSRVLSEIDHHLKHLAEDAAIRFVVFRSAGKVFLAGADISQMSHFTEDDGHAFSKHGHHVFNTIEQLPQITIAAMNGAAMGGGCELAMACDFRLIAAHAKIGQPESKLGLIPGWGGTIRLPKLVGLSQAKRLMFSGEPITAQEALNIGLVDEVVPTPEELDGALKRWYETFAKASPAAITRIKRTLQHHDEIHQFSLCFSCSDAREGIRAFLEKRPPAWSK